MHQNQYGPSTSIFAKKRRILLTDARAGNLLPSCTRYFRKVLIIASIFGKLPAPRTAAPRAVIILVPFFPRMHSLGPTAPVILVPRKLDQLPSRKNRKKGGKSPIMNGPSKYNLLATNTKNTNRKKEVPPCPKNQKANLFRNKNYGALASLVNYSPEQLCTRQILVANVQKISKEKRYPSPSAFLSHYIGTIEAV